MLCQSICMPLNLKLLLKSAPHLKENKCSQTFSKGDPVLYLKKHLISRAASIHENTQYKYNVLTVPSFNNSLFHFLYQTKMIDAFRFCLNLP